MSSIPGRSEFIRSQDSSSTAYALHKCLNARVTGQFNDDQFVAAVRGTCTEQEFIDAVSQQLRAAPASTPSVMGLINRLYRRGEVSLGIVRALESRISRGELRATNDGAAHDSGPGVERSPLLVGRQTPPPVEPGRVLRERYVIEQRLGYGGRGTVFRALDRYRSSLPAGQRYVAVKILHDCGSREETIDALRRELQCAQMLTHQNIVRVFDLDRDGDIDFFTMELLEGELLSGLMARFHPLPMSRAHAWSIIGQIAAGLAHAHERQIVHADLKPQNILINKSGEVRILDFGASRLLENQGHAQPGARPSSVTSAYACCELLDGRAPDPRDDLYAMACIAYELLTGEHPFQRRRANDARDFGVVPVRPPGLGRRQWLTLSKSLSWHRAGRSMSARDWYKGLQPRREAQRLPAIGHLAPAPIKPRRAPSFRASAVFTLLISTAAIWMLFVRLAPGGKVSGEPLATAPLGQTASMPQSAPQPPTLDARGPLLSSAGASTSTGGAALTPGDYQVQPGQHFAEIRFHRPASWRGDKPLVWWTEAASAKPGVDYVQQPKVQQAFPKGKNSMSFFVKLLPRAARSQPEVFYVAVADPAERGSERIRHTAVRLPES